MKGNDKMKRKIEEMEKAIYQKFGVDSKEYAGFLAVSKNAKEHPNSWNMCCMEILFSAFFQKS